MRERKGAEKLEGKRDKFKKGRREGGEREEGIGGRRGEKGRWN